jgi:hypothetical protein
VQLPSWTRERRVVFARKLQGTTPGAARGTFWSETKHELAAYVTDLPVEEVNAWQVQPLYRERADAENVFDELKNRWGFNPTFRAQKKDHAGGGIFLPLVTWRSTRAVPCRRYTDEAANFATACAV